MTEQAPEHLADDTQPPALELDPGSPPEQLWVGEWIPAPDQPRDSNGRYLPRPSVAE